MYIYIYNSCVSLKHPGGNEIGEKMLEKATIERVLKCSLKNATRKFIKG